MERDELIAYAEKLVVLAERDGEASVLIERVRHADGLKEDDASAMVRDRASELAKILESGFAPVSPSASPRSAYFAAALSAHVDEANVVAVFERPSVVLTLAVRSNEVRLTAKKSRRLSSGGK